MKNNTPQFITLEEFSQDLTPEERKIVETEKKYYEVVMALRKKRKSMGLTQDQLASLSQIPRATITKIESGSRNATLQTIMAIAQAMGKSVELRLV